ncbi:Outer membrane transport energization protein ExbB [Syntrophobacter sp. SbD1]|nr:Outer membrane transport energization protein ExbB [Syntrophobacter sp. SbD1]
MYSRFFISVNQCSSVSKKVFHSCPSVSKKFLLVASIVLVSILSGALQAHAWWDDKWQYRRKIVFDTTPAGADIKANLDDSAVLIRLHAGNFNFAAAKEDGSDVRFMSGDDKLPLKFQKEVYDPANEMALFWVRVPRIMAASKQDSSWIYYGNKSAPQAQQDQGGVYDVNQVLIYHLDEEEGKPKDDTAYGNQPSESASEMGIPAVIGAGLTLNGSGDRIVIPRSPSLNFSTGFTFSAWVRISQPQNNARLLSWEDQNQGIVVGIDQTKVFARATTAGQKIETGKTADLPIGSWHHLAVTAEPSKRIVIYLDGAEIDSVNLPGALPEPASDLCIGASLKEGGFFSGDLDEIELSKTARSADWLRAAFKGQGPDNLLASVMEEEGNSGGGQSLTVHLMGVVARTITLDGWIVIGTLVFLGALCWIVFLTKSLSIRQLLRSNTSFLDQLKESPAFDTLYNSEDDQFPRSSLYRIYNAGFDELKLARSKMNKENNGISKSMLSLIRSALDKSMMYESRRLGAGLMVLTLGISGGPFLGLLGTVWGVMNTFAGMAEAGEANLMAIAPGVASALACTLFGLLVAIPALFTYSFLTHRIKDLNADMFQFADEFVIKLEGEE